MIVGRSLRVRSALNEGLVGATGAPTEGRPYNDA
jgi:hypothetical protein